MKATGALPTEERVQKMSDLQWLWYYRNLVKDEEEHNKGWQDRLDYIGWWINPKMAEGVMNSRKNKDNATNKFDPKRDYEDQVKNAPIGQSIVHEHGDVVVNSSFEEELRRAMAETGEEPTVLPESGAAGNVAESKDDFIARAMAMQGMFDGMDSIPHENDSIPHENDEEQSQTQNQEKDINIEDLPPGFNPDDIDYFEFPKEEEE